MYPYVTNVFVYYRILSYVSVCTRILIARMYSYVSLVYSNGTRIYSYVTRIYFVIVSTSQFSHGYSCCGVSRPLMHDLETFWARLIFSEAFGNGTRSNFQNSIDFNLIFPLRDWLEVSLNAITEPSKCHGFPFFFFCRHVDICVEFYVAEF